MPNDKNLKAKHLRCFRHGEVIDDYESKRITKDGRRLDVSLTISPIKDSAGHIVGASITENQYLGVKSGTLVLQPCYTSALPNTV
jgi:hypothetical protein